MKVHLGDTVLVRKGKYRGKTGKVTRVLANRNQIVVEKVNIRTKHIKKAPDRPGDRIQFEAPIDASNVMVLAPESKKPSRVGYIMLENGKKQRILKKFPQENLERPAEIKKTTKKR